ncbi:hypothetical protein ATCC90586_003850 [Pythium insidiosum]|nr:hypothetical protein ATCC90586_003850 [Pythium insidiosum]
MTHARRIVAFAALSRVAVSLVAALTALIVTPYDTSNRLRRPASRMTHALSAFANWDGVYFAHIATNGYDYEHVHAFFPLYPLLLRGVRRISLPFLPDDAVAVPLAGWLLSNASFVLAAVYLYRLGRLVLGDERVARRAALLFCVAPSGIFMSALYSESLMCLLSFSGMFYLERYRRSTQLAPLVLCAALFGLASATRSNGALLSLFIAWQRLRDSPSPRQLARFLRHWLTTAALGVVAVGPQVLYFARAIFVYCPSLVGPSGPAPDRPWCRAVIPNVSAMYMFIQREYWNVGLLRYYEWRQLPNFLLAAPILTLSTVTLARAAAGHAKTTPIAQALGPYAVHHAFLVANALLVVHIQVTTRLLAACPTVFWLPALFFLERRQDPSGRAVVAYSLLFSVLGAVLFSAFYPWT